MRKAIYAGGVLAVLVAVVLISQTRAAAQNQNRLAIQGDLLSLVGPGSSIGITVRDSDSGVVVQSVRTRDASVARRREGRRHRHGIRWRADKECRSVHSTGPRDGPRTNGENDRPPERRVDDDGHLARESGRRRHPVSRHCARLPARTSKCCRVTSTSTSPIPGSASTHRVDSA